MAVATETRWRAGREWLLRATTGSRAQLREVVAQDEGLRRPLPRPCVMGVVQAGGGAGATTLTAGLGVLLAGRRSGAVVAVDAGAGEAALARVAGIAEPVDLSACMVAEQTAPGRSVLPALPTGAAGLAVLGTGTSGGYRPPTTPAAWAAAVAPVVDDAELVLTDWGVRRTETGDVAAISQTHDVCIVVGRADIGASGPARPLVYELAQRTRVVLVLVDVGGTALSALSTGGMLEQDWSEDLVGLGLRVPVVVVPHDPVAGRNGIADLDRAGTAVHLAWARVATAALELAGGGA